MSIQHFFGIFSLVLILISGAMHCTRVAQGKIILNPISWFVWFGISFAILISYYSVGAKYNMYAAVGNVIFPGINFMFALRQKSKVPLEKIDIICGMLGVASILLWVMTKDDPGSAQYANYLALIADLCAVVPTYRLVRKMPMVEKPLPWMLFSIGFGMSIFSITTHTIANYILPIYMCIGSSIIAFVQIRYRLRNNITEKWY